MLACGGLQRRIKQFVLIFLTQTIQVTQLPLCGFSAESGFFFKEKENDMHGSFAGSFH